MSPYWEASSLRAEEHGCNSCGAKGDKFYEVRFYILPSRLIRKRHKDRSQTAIYCRACYEKNPYLPYLIDGEPASVPTTPRVDPQHANCPVCDRRIGDALTADGGLYGLITSSLLMELSIIENWVLVTFCEPCVESHKISLQGKI